MMLKMRRQPLLRTLGLIPLTTVISKWCLIGA
jgi:hypothetical protein